MSSGFCANPKADDQVHRPERQGVRTRRPKVAAKCPKAKKGKKKGKRGQTRAMPEGRRFESGPRSGLGN